MIGLGRRSAPRRISAKKSQNSNETSSPIRQGVTPPAHSALVWLRSRVLGAACGEGDFSFGFLFVDLGSLNGVHFGGLGGPSGSHFGSFWPNTDVLPRVFDGFRKMSWEASV